MAETAPRAPSRHYEDFAVGQTVDCGETRLSRDDIVSFAAAFDPQPIHLDDAAAERGMLNGLSASGWHVCAAMMRMICDAYLLDTASEGSPGVQEIRWRAPTRPDAPLALRMEVTGVRRSKSRPAVGFVSQRLVLTSLGETICTQQSVGIIRRREATADELAALGRKDPGDRREPPDSDPLADATTPEATPEWVDPTASPLGRPIDIGEERIDADSVVAFARRYDPQPMHVDAAAAEKSLFGGLCASGWQTGALWMRRQVDARNRAMAALAPADRDRVAASFGPSPGVKNLEWRRPVFVGDVLRFFHTPTDRRALASRPGWSVFGSRNGAVNQRGELVLTFESHVFARSG